MKCPVCGHEGWNGEKDQFGHAICCGCTTCGWSQTFIKIKKYPCGECPDLYQCGVECRCKKYRIELDHTMSGEGWVDALKDRRCDRI